MFIVRGPTREVVDAELEAFEALFQDAVTRVMEEVARNLGRTITAAAEPVPGEPAVSMDTLALLGTLWITQVAGTPEEPDEEPLSGAPTLGAALRAIYYRAVNAVRRGLLGKKPAIPPGMLTPVQAEVNVVRDRPVASDDNERHTSVPGLPEDDSDELDVIFPVPDDIAESLLSEARNRMVRFSDELWEVAREQLLEGFAEGESIEELRDRLVGVVGLTEKRATVVARTEVISASNAGSLAMVQYSDFTGTKTWLATDDMRTRPTHVDAEGQTVGLEEAFTVGGSSLQFPGDPSGKPEECIQCRCTLLYRLDEDESSSEPVVASSHEEGCTAMAEEDVVTDAVTTADGAWDMQEMPDDEMEMGREVGWNATLVVEGIPTGDGRQFADNSLTWGDLPLPLLWQRKTAEGHAESVVVGKITEMSRDGNAILGRGVFNTKCDEAQEVIYLIEEKFVRGVSVDVDSISQADMEFLYPEEAVEGDEFVSPELVVFHSGRIRGATICAIQAFVEATISVNEPETSEEETVPEDEYELVASAVPSHSTDTSDGPWDAGVQEKRLGTPLALATAKKMYAWYDADAVDGGDVDKSKCKFPHHEVSADGTPGAANLTACSAGIGALHGARTPTNIPEEERRGVYDHLARHLRDGGQTPPEFDATTLTASGIATGGIITVTRPVLVGERGPEAIVPLRASAKHETLDEFMAVKTLQAAAYVLTIPDVPPAWWFTEPTDVNMYGALTVTDEGRVYGWLAPAGVAHRSFERRVTVPMGNVDYSRFMGRETIVDGGRVVSGALTMDCGHASTGYSDSDRAMDHYDNACSIVATVAIGERSGKGVWVAGAVVPGITANQISRMMACQLSGDWRPHKEKSGWREFAGALLVPVPGFAMARAQASVRMDEGQLVASAIPVRYAETAHDCGCSVVAAAMESELESGEVEVTPIDLSSVAAFIASSIGRDVATRQRELATLVHGQEE